MQPLNEPNVRVPVRVTDTGNLEFFYGGPMPKLRVGTVADLVVPAYAIENTYQLELLQRIDELEALPKGTPLAVMVSVRSLPKLRQDRRTHVVQLEGNHPSHLSGEHWVRATLQEPLKVCIRGAQVAELSACRVCIPALERTADSVNEAYTRISEVFEPQRRSHTGNVFAKVCYWDKLRGCWRLLGDRRDELLGEAEQTLRILHQRWWYRTSQTLFGDMVVEWFCIEPGEQGAAAVHAFSPDSVQVASWYFAGRDQAEAFLAIYEEFDPGSPPDYQMRPPEPPYHRPDGALVYLVPDVR